MHPSEMISYLKHCIKVVINLKNKKVMGVNLREKQLSNGQISLYLDIYHNKARWYEFLDIHINKTRPNEADKEKKRLAKEICIKRQHELILEDNGLNDRKKKLACFVIFFEEYVNDRKYNGLYAGVLSSLKKFAGKQPIPFARLSAEWMKDFERYLLPKVSNNTVIRYLKTINGAINEAVRKRIINRNPWHDLHPNQKLKMQDIFRNSFTIDQLQFLANTKCKVDIQIRQAYLFSCFSGLRWSDVNPLKWDEIIVKNVAGKEQYFIHFEQEKTEEILYLPLSENAIEIIKKRKEASLSESYSLFVFPRVKEIDGTRSKYQHVNRALKIWAKAAKFDPKKLHFHSGRHSFATNILENSEQGDLYTVSKLLGHKDIQTTQIYAKVRDKRKMEAVMGLPKINFSKVK